jgi:hypothetical protein
MAHLLLAIALANNVFPVPGGQLIIPLLVSLLQQAYISLLLKMKQFLRIQLSLHQYQRYRRMKSQYLVVHQNVQEIPKFIGDCPPPDEKFSNFGKEN